MRSDGLRADPQEGTGLEADPTVKLSESAPDGDSKLFDVRLVAAASRPCVYAPDTPCLEEWPGLPWEWCGSCLAKAVTSPPADLDSSSVESANSDPGSGVSRG